MPFIKDGVAHLPLQKTPHHRRWFALVDVEDYERAVNVRWMGFLSGRTIYVRATSSKYLPAHHMNLHAFVLKVPPGVRVDHENNNGLDCRKVNLRVASGEQNARNALKTNSRHVTSRFKGVGITSSGRWGASITLDGQPSVLGVYDQEADAARAYDVAALRLFGEFAKTNAAMGLFDHIEPVRDMAGWNVKPGTDLGPFVSREQIVGEAEPRPWEVEFLENPERRNFFRVVSLTRHRRTAAVLYRLENGQACHPTSYTGPPVPAEELERMTLELHERDRERLLAKVARRAALQN